MHRSSHRIWAWVHNNELTQHTNTIRQTQSVNMIYSKETMFYLFSAAQNFIDNYLSLRLFISGLKKLIPTVFFSFILLIFLFSILLILSYPVKQILKRPVFSVL